MATKPALIIPKLHLNLLYPQGLSPKLPAKFLKWSLTYGKLIVIFVEILVVGAFLTRYKLDSDLADLKDQINPQIDFVQSLDSDDSLIRQTQFKLLTIKSKFDTSPQWDIILSQIASQTPSGIKFTNLSFEHLNNSLAIKFKISGQAISNNDIAVFQNGLIKDAKFKDITLTNLSSDQNQILFTITGGT